METRPPVVIWSSVAATLVAAARDAGWTAVEDDADADADAATIAIVDARADLDGACAVLAASRGAPRIALVAGLAVATQDRLIAAGATQIAMVAADGTGLAQALALAATASGIERDRRLRTDRPQPSTEWIAERLAEGRAVTAIHVAIVRLDLVNAAHGRDRGTALIEAAERRVAAQVAALAEDDGVVARATGAGIVAAIALPPERAVVTAARIEEALARPFRFGAASAVLGTRLGIAWSRGGEDAASLLARAAAEASPVSVAAVDDPLAVDIHLALARDEITLLFQPQASLPDGTIVGVEALARWQHPTRGCLGAEDLFAAASRAGIGVALSEHIHHRVLARIAAWPAALARLRVALNLTAADLARPGFVDTLLAQVDASGVARERLTLEITETELMADLDGAAAALAALQEAGCRIAIDDFGAGYSSLAYLAALPLDYLKLDRSLSEAIEGPRRRRIVVRGAIDMARSLGLTVIAEGVETEAQRAALADAGCAVYQGFLLAPPLGEAALVTQMETPR